MDLIKCLLALLLGLIAPSVHAQTREERLANNRLPGDLRPYNYYLELKTDIYNDTRVNHTYTGVVQISFDCVAETNQIYINVRDYEPDRQSLTISVAPETNVTAPQPVITNANVSVEAEFYIIDLQDNLVVGAKYQLQLTFGRNLETRRRAFFQLSYTSNFETRWMAVTRFLASDARAAFPCFDEPEYRATFDVVLLRKIEYRTVSNMQLVRQDPRPDEWIADVFARTPVMSTWTLTFAVCDFQYRERAGARGVLTRLWSRPDQLPLTERASGFATQLLEFYETLFGIDYPLTKLDHLAVPMDDRQVIMLGWGLIIYSERVLMHHEGESDIRNLVTTYTGLSHEVAHQWFGNLVTQRWWDDLWLSVGVATYFNFIPFGTLLRWPGWQLQASFSVREALLRDASPFTVPVAATRNTPQEGRRSFNQITYVKSAAFLRMMSAAVGGETFLRALNRYLTRFQYSSATTQDLWDVFQEQVDADNVTEPDGRTRFTVQEKFDPWIRQEGYPVVQFDRNTPFGVLARLNQTRHVMFADSEINTTSPWNYQWWVPITVYHEDQSRRTLDTQFYLPPNTGLDVTSGLPPAQKLLVANVDRVGFYRVIYDQPSIDQLRAAIENRDVRLPTMNRASLLDDLFQYHRANRIAEVEPMNFTRMLAIENQLLIWRVATDNMGYIDAMFRRESVFGDHERYWRARVDPVYRRLRFVRPEDVRRRMTRQIVTYWSCYYNNAECLQTAVTAFNDWWSNPITRPMEADQMLTYMCAAVRVGEEFEWNVVFALYRAFGNYRTQQRYMAAMACSREYYILERYMVALENGDVQPLGAFFLSLNTLGTEIVWRHLRDRWNDSPFPSFIKRIMLIGNAITRNRPEELQEFEDFVAQNPPLDEREERTYNFTRRLIENNVNWMALNKGPLAGWYATNAPPPSNDDPPKTQAAGGGVGLMFYAIYQQLEDLELQQAMGQLDEDATKEDMMIMAVRNLLPHIPY